MATMAQKTRKRNPLIRQACPKCGVKHGGVLVVYTSREGCRYFRCHRFPLCNGKRKGERN